ncbi:MAG: hypothetical protein AAGA21_03445 [Pseudomonadota bacterium]
MWYACSVVVGNFANDPDLSERHELSHGIGIEPTPDWLRNAGSAEQLSAEHQDLIDCSRLVLSVDYEAEALGSLDPDWTGDTPRSIQTTIDEKLGLAQIACWLVKPSPFSCGPLLHFDQKGNHESLRESGSLKQIFISEKAHENVLSKSEILESGRLLEEILHLDRNGVLWLAIRTLISSLTENNWQIRYLLHWIVIETLFGPDDGELSYRIAQRISFFLANQSSQRKQVFQDIKKGYTWRSKIVHGAKIDSLSKEKSLELTEIIESLIRRCLCKILRDGSLRESINGKERNEFLDDLVFQ